MCRTLSFKQTHMIKEDRVALNSKGGCDVGVNSTESKASNKE